ncbi:Ankyrin repeat and MYND domain-containing protein 2 [Homalodisca vitripennis]|nr:Ankyrin repeat and MYND domain-containing protein 2 [Homalodisca vitripennis]
MERTKMAPSEKVDEDEKKIFDCIAKNNIVEFKALIHTIHGDIFDEHGMTPLQHAAYKGNKEIVQLLLDQQSDAATLSQGLLPGGYCDLVGADVNSSTQAWGADVNSGRHKHGYSALNFGVLSGDRDGADVNSGRHKHGYSALNFGVLSGDRDGADVNSGRHKHGYSALNFRVFSGDRDGADVNSGRHKHGYSALHFGVLSGNTDVCELLLTAGAKTHATNSVGKTPMEMAAFVGNHMCVAIINNFVPRVEVDYFTVPQGLESEPKLPPSLAGHVHKFAMQFNMNPVRIALNLQPNLVAALDTLRNVLTLMSDRQMRRKETNELMAFKLHYLANVVAEVAKCRQVEREKPSDPVEAFARKVLRSVRGREYTERFIRDCVREFPHRECTIFRQMYTGCNNPMEIDLVILVAKGEALHDQSSVQEIDDLSKQKRHVKSGEVLRHAGSTNLV